MTTGACKAQSYEDPTWKGREIKIFRGKSANHGIIVCVGQFVQYGTDPCAQFVAVCNFAIDFSIAVMGKT